ncbi:hypothetical protein ACLBYG_22450 [Methylobacterium sp. D53M]
MPSSTVTLGGFTFRGHEVPEQIPFGGGMRIAKNVLIGGERVPDAMGWEPTNPRWRGRFRGAEAKSRAIAVQRIAQRGARVPLSWGGIRLTVIIEKFEPDYRRSNDIPYEIECYTVDDGSGGGAPDFGSDAGALIGGDMSSLAGLADGIGLGGVADAIGALSDSLDAVGSLALAPLGAISGLQTIATSAIDAIDTAVSVGDARLDAANVLNPAFLAGPGLALALDGAVDALTAQDALLQARGLAGRISANIDTLGV